MSDTVTTQSAALQLQELEARVKAINAEQDTLRRRTAEMDFEIGNISLTGLGATSLPGLRKEKLRIQAQLEELGIAIDVARVRRSDLEKKLGEESDATSAAAYYAGKAACADALVTISPLAQQIVATIGAAAVPAGVRGSLFDGIVDALKQAKYDSISHLPPRLTLTERLAELEARYRRQAAPGAVPAAKGVRQKADTAVHASAAIRYKDTADPEHGERHIPANFIGLVPCLAAERACQLGLAQKLPWPPPGRRFVGANAPCRLADDSMVRPGHPRMVDSTTLVEARLESGELFEPETMPAEAVASFRGAYPGEPVLWSGGIDLGDLQDERWAAGEVARPKDRASGYVRTALA